jgi:hypothetical protein
VCVFPAAHSVPQLLLAIAVKSVRFLVCALLQDTLYHSFFQHLLARLPARLADHVVGLLGNFATREPCWGWCCLVLGQWQQEHTHSHPLEAQGRCEWMSSAGLGWAGLGWAGLGWAGLGWAGLTHGCIVQ